MKEIGCIKFSCLLQLILGKPSGNEPLIFCYILLAVSNCWQTYSDFQQYPIRYLLNSTRHLIFAWYGDLNDMHRTIRFCEIRANGTLHPASLHFSAEKRHAHKGRVTSSSILFNEIHLKKWKQPFHRW